VYGLHNSESTLWRWYKKDKNVFSRCVWDDRRTYRGGGRNSPSLEVLDKFENPFFR